MNTLWDNLFREDKSKRGVRESLRQNILFQDLGILQLKVVETIVNLRQYRPGEVIFRQGEVGVGMYIIVSGTVNIYVEEIQASSGDIQTTHVTQLKKDDFFGELALVEEGGRRSASAKAHDECVLIGFFKPDLLEIMERNPVAGMKILARLGEVLGARLRQTTGKISEIKKDHKNP